METRRLVCLILVVNVIKSFSILTIHILSLGTGLETSNFLFFFFFFFFFFFHGCHSQDKSSIILVQAVMLLFVHRAISADYVSITLKVTVFNK